MTNDRSGSTARTPWLRAALLALGLAAAAATAHAQTVTPSTLAGKVDPAPAVERAAAPSSADPVEGVTITGRRPAAVALIPDDKRAEYDQDVAREAAFRDYRASQPRITADDKDVGDPNQLSKDFPGLQSYLPK